MADSKFNICGFIWMKDVISIYTIVEIKLVIASLILSKINA